MTDALTFPSPGSSLLICDDRPPDRQALIGLLAPTWGAEGIRVVGDGPGLTAAFTARSAELVLVGLHRGAQAGTDVTGELLDRHPSAAVIVYGSPQDTDLLTAAVTRGALGLMLWDATGGRARPPWPTPNRSRSAAAGRTITDPPLLTEREQQVLQAISQGRSNQEIGRQLFLSEDTVKTHARRLFRKLGASDRAHAVALGFRQGLLTGHAAQPQGGRNDERRMSGALVL